VAISAIQQHNNRFPLLGAHAAATCDQCHVGAAAGVYTGLSTQCASCHIRDYQRATPNHVTSKLPTTCQDCHGINTWLGARFNHAQFTGFALTGAHATAACLQCHRNNNFALTSAACINCHLTDFDTTTSPPHRSAGFPLDCTLCHGTAALNWTTATNFDHGTTGFALTGAHTTVECARCHTNNNFKLTSGACINCHLADFSNTRNPPHKTAGFAQDCSLCHTTANWSGATFNHATTGFTLVGVHATQQCATCHVNNNFNLTSTACINCHLTEFNAANNPPHRAAGFPQDCTVCHGTAIVNWMSAPTFNHNSTGFTLTGAHTNLLCAQCHANNNFSLTSGACINCHLTDFNNTNNPPHKPAGFPQDCSGCHTTINWNGAVFNHTTTGFALTGTHTNLACSGCHTNGNFSLTSGACINCHLTDFNTTTNPPHKAANFPQDCTGCHTTLNWSGATFNHTTTGFTLVGVHATQQCATCHVNNNFNLTSTACINCHLTEFNTTSNPPHRAAGLPQDCTICHGTGIVNWTSATFNHATTGFTLVGAHATQQCAACHANSNFSLTSAACITCHLPDFNGTTNPPHKTAGFPQDCTLCHGSAIIDWTSGTFNHSATGFTLAGAHTSVQCARCHANNNFSLTSAACFNCHQDKYNLTTNPPHKAAGFPQDCTVCHGAAPLDWTTATFNHSATGFTLAGAHTSVQCAQCHANSNFSLTSAACFNCHQDKYNGAMNPPHKALNFPQDCTGCHGTAPLDWTTATFNHGTTGFPLTGAHTTQACSSCHGTGNFTTLSSPACWNCHQADYNGATNPPHKTLGFPQDCSGCHTTTNWGGATFNHATTGFMLTGAHATQPCSGCHGTTFTNLTSAACWNCHQANYNGTTNPPHQAAAFPQDCSLCHSTTNWSGATFNHPTSPLQLTAYHAMMLANNQCSQCHVGNNYTSTPSDCYSCHKLEYQNTTNPNHAAAGFATTCNSCHSFVDWTGAKFTTHDNSYFPIYSGKHNGKWTACGDCHSNSTNYAVFTCIACHEHSNQSDVTSKHHGVSGFAYTATSCYGCHPKGVAGNN
jgi:hypothetical protein